MQRSKLMLPSSQDLLLLKLPIIIIIIITTTRPTNTLHVLKTTTLPTVQHVAGHQKYLIEGYDPLQV